jgi:lipopolysaccharide/colanic/teichoic acid biosynthesis glycosyltransferase
MCKRVFDIIISSAAIIILLPVFFIVVVAIRLTSKGPAIFKQEGAGKKSIPFTFYKVRTMKTNVDSFSASPKSKNDPRLTAAGKWLREYSLDELPQLFNVLKGDMSIVGLRPLYLSRVSEWSQQ